MADKASEYGFLLLSKRQIKKVLRENGVSVGEYLDKKNNCASGYSNCSVMRSVPQ